MTELIQELLAVGVRLPRYTSGTQKTTCPKCSQHRKKKHDPCLSVTIDGDGVVWNCHNDGCGFSGGLSGRGSPDVPTIRKTPVRPDYRREDMPLHIKGWFRDRCISEVVLLRNGIGYDSGRGAISYPFMRNGEVVNVKFRKLPKTFSQISGATQVFYGLDDLAGHDIGIITEGEMDKLACEEAGFINVISLPSGALTLGRGESKQVEFIANSLDHIKHIKTWILAGDTDTAGLPSQEELARLLGRDKCLRVTWPTAGDAPCKDANDTLINHGKNILRECIELAQPYPVRNIVEIDPAEGDLLRLYRGEAQKAYSTGWPCLDGNLKIGDDGVLSVVTGTPGSGKSEWIDALMVNLAENENWKFGICSFENPVERHRAKLVSKRMHLPFWDGPSMRMSEKELLTGAQWVRQHFCFIRFDEDSPTIDAILEAAKGAVLRHGIRGMVIDPYNEIEHKRPAGMPETEYVSEMLSKVKRFAQNHGVHVWFVAHPAKILPDKDGKRRVPTLYDISGSANWVNKADIGIVISHDPEPGTVEIHIRKVRHQPQQGRPGMVKLYWDKKTGRYEEPHHFPARQPYWEDRG